MNYIKHLTGFFEKVSTDFDLNPTHISLYMAIFQLWNQNRFQNPIGITRDELMRISKIASSATYHKCMKDLTANEYVIYKPSYNPFKGSTLEVINLDHYTKPILKKDIKKLKSQQKNEQDIKQVNEQPNEHVNEQPIEQVLNKVLNKHQTSSKHVPYINNINITNSKNFVNGRAQKNNQKKVKISKEIPEDFEEVKRFFEEKKCPNVEAEKFFNHFQSNGWLVGGKSKMKDWKAAARNWILNSKIFNTSKKSHPEIASTERSPSEGLKPNHLNVKTDKNYEEPL